MAQYGGDQYGRKVDEFGNPIPQSGQYGTTTGAAGGRHHDTTGAFGTDQFPTTDTTGAYMTDDRPHVTGTTGGHQTHGGGIAPGYTDAGLAAGGGHHRRSGSSSSSSEDDGQGGRRKKGMKQKIKEKISGGGHDTQAQAQPAGVGGYGYEHGGTGAHHEKKGMMEKIKEKLPGGGGTGTGTGRY